jgi:esterase
MSLLHSIISGQGKPLLILHGFLGMSDNWKTLGNYYSKNGFEVHLIDQRNHGRSFHADEFSYNLMSSDLNNYMGYHQISNVNLIGHSMGGKTAMFFALQYPEKVEKLLIADIAPKYYPVHHQNILKGLNSVKLEKVSSRRDAEEQLSLFIKDAGIRQFLLKNLYRKDKQSFGWRMNLPILSQHIEKVGEASPQDLVFSGNTLFLKGSNSEYLLPEDHAKIFQQFPKAAIKAIEGAGHWLHAENPEEFIKLSMDFLENH